MSALRKVKACIRTLRGNVAEIDETAKRGKFYETRIRSKTRGEAYRRCLRMLCEIRDELERENDTRRTA